jgi:hypothetical protein
MKNKGVEMDEDEIFVAFYVRHSLFGYKNIFLYTSDDKPVNIPLEKQWEWINRKEIYYITDLKGENNN